ncbi:hypothetical protein TRVL_07216 [Trypanosoma vivax]|uniref:Uncharacterized protein n=1 Tax=Trypanosoma vivax (strain Y486) TaxID=1055687 RepID=G0TZP5_TRYVY|nr:hypothetical protein TRVL_07216 [Trypanosoma vivax]CCC50073.1 conserved hypothetical protein [Trypanosoma vivax Y486]
MHRIRRFDMFSRFDPALEEAGRERTTCGGLLSFLFILLVALFIKIELYRYLSVVELREMYVDPHVGGDMHITINITFPHIHCDLMAVDVIGPFGEYMTGAVRSITKVRVPTQDPAPVSEALPQSDRSVSTAALPVSNKMGGCVSCYGAEESPGDCCNSCDDVHAAFRRNGWEIDENDIKLSQCTEGQLHNVGPVSPSEGCNIHSKFSVRKIKGNIHFVPGRRLNHRGQPMYVVRREAIKKMNLSHVFHSLEFGERFPGQVNPLNGIANARGVRNASEVVSGRFSYYVQVLPTEYQFVPALGSRVRLETNQYSVKQHFTESWYTTDRRYPGWSDPTLVAGVFIVYDVSPVKTLVMRTSPYPSLIHLLLRMCAVGGGAFTVASMIDSLLLNILGHFRRKMRETKYL